MEEVKNACKEIIDMIEEIRSKTLEETGIDIVELMNKDFEETDEYLLTMEKKHE